LLQPPLHLQRSEQLRPAFLQPQWPVEQAERFSEPEHPHRSLAETFLFFFVVDAIVEVEEDELAENSLFAVVETDELELEADELELEAASAFLANSA
jgi:hypothetical protein